MTPPREDTGAAPIDRMTDTYSNGKDVIRITKVNLTTVQTRRRTGAISSHIVLQFETDAGISTATACTCPIRPR